VELQATGRTGKSDGDGLERLCRPLRDRELTAARCAMRGQVACDPVKLPLPPLLTVGLTPIWTAAIWALRAGALAPVHPDMATPITLALEVDVRHQLFRVLRTPFSVQDST